MTKIDFYFDYASPAAYLAFERLLQLQAEGLAVEINYKPMLLGGLFKLTGNSAPVTVPAKGKYLLNHDLPRFSKRYGVEFKMNPHFPVNSLALMRAAYGAIEAGCFEQYSKVVYEAIWLRGLNMADPEVAVTALNEAGLDGAALLASSQDQSNKDKLMATTQEACDRGAFGAPTFYLGDDMFFGQDRLDFIEEAIRAAS